MKTAAILGFSSLLAGLVAAAPLEKRAYVTHTVTEEVVETVDVTITITVEPVTTTPAEAAAQAAETTEAAYSWSWDHGHHHEAQHAQETQAPAATTTHEEEAYVAQTEAPTATTTTAPVQEEEHHQEEEQHEEEQHQEQQQQQQQQQEQPEEQYQEAAQEEVQEAQVQQQENYVQPSQQSSGGGSHTGDITYYHAGLGACGWVNDGTSEYVVALSHELMGEQSNGNPYCGKMIEVNRGGKTVQAKVVDKCMDCPYNNVDLSEKAFYEVATQEEGRVPGCSWKFLN